MAQHNVKYPETVVSGTSRRVFLSETFVTKRPIHHIFLDEDKFKEAIFLGEYGKFENLKEYFLWFLISEKKYIKNTFANICKDKKFDFKEGLIYQERLLNISPEIYSLFLDKYDFIRMSRFRSDGINYPSPLNSHTIDNPENFGIDFKGNLKILDFALETSYIFELYNVNLESFNNGSYKILERKILDDILVSDNTKLSNKIYSELLPLILALKYYNNWPGLLSCLYKKNIITFKDVVTISWERLKTIF